jgi:hypothetical protein
MRARKGETIPLDYLKLCHDYHEKWLCPNEKNEKNEKNILILDGNKDIRTNPETVNDWINIIKETFMQ